MSTLRTDLRSAPQSAGVGKLRPTRVAFINTHPIQYFAPLYAALNQPEELSVTALYLSDYSVRGATDHAFGQTVKWDVDLLAGYDVRFVRGAKRRGEPTGFFSMIAPELWYEVRRGVFDALVVHGHTPAAMLVAVAAAKLMHIPTFLRCDTHLGLPRSIIKSLLRRPLIGTYYRRLDGVLAIGSANREFHRAMGIPDRRIFHTPFTVDNRRFMTGARFADGERKELRASFGVDDERPIVLYAAKFQRRKRPDDLLRAAARLNREGVVFHLVMVGSGEMGPELHALAQHLALSNITFAGFVNQVALPQVYAACDVFVLPSENEPWGLAVNEAMCAGLPIVASSEIGCVPDLVHDGRNGHTFPAGDVFGLADVLRPMLEDPELRQRMGAASRDIIALWSYAECRTGLRAALASVGLSSSVANGSLSRHRNDDGLT
jgi:glycosyltransferase involved in cell wall biosynthesis